MQVYQATLKQSVSLEGIGVHSGEKTVVTLRPAPINHGIIFRRPDGAGIMRSIPANAAHSLPADLCTVLVSDEKGSAAPARAETVEHLMAAIAACGPDNLLIEVSEKETPILDGSAKLFVEAIQKAGIERQSAKRRYLRILKPVRATAEKSDSYAEFLPLEAGAPAAQLFEVEINFPAKAIGRQQIAFSLEPDFFARNIAAARTFGFWEQAEKLRAQGLARGSSLENSVVLDSKGEVINPQALIAADGFVRHKALDAVGDTALLGAPFIGLFKSFKGGHKLNSAAVRALLADKSAYEMVELS